MEGVDNKNLSGTCAKTNLDAIAIRAYQLENEFKDWANYSNEQTTNNNNPTMLFCSKANTSSEEITPVMPTIFIG